MVHPTALKSLSGYGNYSLASTSRGDITPGQTQDDKAPLESIKQDSIVMTATVTASKKRKFSTKTSSSVLIQAQEECKATDEEVSSTSDKKRKIDDDFIVNTLADMDSASCAFYTPEHKPTNRFVNTQLLQGLPSGHFLEASSDLIKLEHKIVQASVIFFASPLYHDVVKCSFGKVSCVARATKESSMLLKGCEITLRGLIKLGPFLCYDFRYQIYVEDTYSVTREWFLMVKTDYKSVIIYDMRHIRLINDIETNPGPFSPVCLIHHVPNPVYSTAVIPRELLEDPALAAQLFVWMVSGSFLRFIFLIILFFLILAIIRGLLGFLVAFIGFYLYEHFSPRGIVLYFRDFRRNLRSYHGKPDFNRWLYSLKDNNFRRWTFTDTELFDMYDSKDIDLMHDVETNPGPTPITFVVPTSVDSDSDNDYLSVKEKKFWIDDVPESLMKPLKVPKSKVKVFDLKAHSSYHEFKKEISIDFNELHSKARKLETKVNSFIKSVESEVPKSIVGDLDFSESSLVDRFIAISESVISEAEAKGMMEQAVLLRGAVKSFTKYHPQMLRSFLPSVPPVTIKVDDDTKVWAAGVLGSIAETVSNPTIGIDFKGLDLKWDSPLVLGVGILVAAVGLRVTTGATLTTISTGLLAVGSLIVTVKYGGTYFEHIYNRLMSLLPNLDGSTVPQSSVDVESLSSLVCSGIFYTIYKSAPREGLIKAAIKSICDFPKLKAGLKEGITSIIELVRSFVNWCSSNVFNAQFHWAPDTPNTEIGKISVELNEILYKLRNGDHYNASNAQRIFNLEYRLREIKANTPTTREFAGEIHALESLLRNIESIASNFVGFSKNGPRVAPFAILIVGPPGVGKGVNFVPLLQDISARVMDEDEWVRFESNPNDEMFNWMTEQEFFEGAHGQFWWMIDEAMQKVDSSTNPDPGVFGLIRVNNIMPFVLNMANCASKGNLCAAPKGIIGTSNVMRADLKSVHDPEAYTRRWNICLLQVPMPKYCKHVPEGDEFADNSIWNRRLDPAKVKSDVISLDISEFYLYDIAHGTVLSKTPFHYREGPTSVVDMLSTKFIANRNYGTNILNFHNTHRLSLAERRAAGEFDHFKAQSKGSTDRKFQAIGEFPDLVSDSDDDEELGRAADELLKESFVQEMKAFNKVRGSVLRPPKKEDYRDFLAPDKYVVKTELGEPTVYRHLRSQYELPVGEPTVKQNRLADMYSRCLGVDFDKSLELVRGYSMTSATSIKEFWLLYKDRFVNKIVDNVKPMVETIVDLVTNRKVLVGLASLLGVVSIVWQLSKSSFIKMSPQSGASKVAQKVKPKAVARVARVPRFNKPQTGSFNMNTNDMMKKLYKNFIYIFSNEATGLPLGYATIVAQRVGYIPKHFLDSVLDARERDPNVAIKFTRLHGDETGRFSFSLLVKDWVEVLDNGDIDTSKYFVSFSSDPEDLCFFNLPSTCCTPHRSIVHFFNNSDAAITKVPFSASLMRFDLSEPLCPYVPISTVARPIGSDVPNADYGYSFETAYAYPIATLDGECGAPLCVTDSRNSLPRIAGFHVAGDGKSGGMAIPVFRESVEAALAYFKTKNTEEFKFDGPAFRQSGIPDRFEIYKEVPVMSTATKTNIVKGRLYGVLGTVKTAPAMLAPRKVGDLIIDPGFKARLKYCIATRLLNQKLLDKASWYTGIQVLDTNREKEDVPAPRILPFEEAVAGNLEMKGIPMSSSTGYPHGLDFNMKKKKNIFVNKDGEIDFSLPSAIKMKELVMENLDQLKAGVRPEIIFMDFLKDETRPLEKVLQGKTRLISSEPVNLTILIRMYFGSFMMHCYNNKIFNGIAIGLNTYSFDWTILAKYLKQVGDNIAAGDHGGYDGRYRAAIYKACLDICERFYYNSTEEERAVRAAIIEILLSSTHCANVFSPDDGKTHAVLYDWFGALPSGTTLTALFGSIGGLIINRYAIYAICLEYEGRSHISFDNNDEIEFALIEKSVKMVQGGDDNLISIGKYLLDRGVDQNSLTRIFDEMGWEYTDETKQGLTHATRPLSKCQFYKRWFVYDSRIGRYKSPLEFDSIDDRNNWISSKAAPGDYERNVRSAILEYSQHTPAVWQERAVPLIAAAKKHLQMFDLPEDQQEAFRELSKLEAYLA